MIDSSLYQVRNLSRRYGESFRLAVDSLDIARGSLFCLLGPTGAGKSTLLRLLSGLETPDAGAITFDGCRWSSSRVPHDVVRRITMVHQRPLLLSASVRANVEFGLRVRGTRKPELVGQTMELLGLRKLMKRPAQSLSGGQTQLVALARALVIEPQVLILDEPTSNLDPAHVQLIEQALARVQERRETTIIWATHNLFQARRVARQVGLLLDGRFVEVSSTETFFTAPSDPRTQAFVEGRMIC